MPVTTRRKRPQHPFWEIHLLKNSFTKAGAGQRLFVRPLSASEISRPRARERINIQQRENCDSISPSLSLDVTQLFARGESEMRQTHVVWRPTMGSGSGGREAVQKSPSGNHCRNETSPFAFSALSIRWKSQISRRGEFPFPWWKSLLILLAAFTVYRMEIFNHRIENLSTSTLFVNIKT